MHRIKHLGFNAIKESFDRLPTGVCFFDRTGSIVLCNRRMYQLSRFLLDSDMQHLGEVQEALSAPARGIVRIPDIDNTYRFPDKTVWRFEKTEVTDRYGVSYIQLTAADVTDLQRALVQLTVDSKKLQEDAEKLKQLSDNAGALAREKELLDVLPQFIGPQMQTPPMYSAVKINGQPLYKMARQGIEVERKARPIEILHIEYEGSPAENEYTLTVHCSKGTYIRVLLEDIAAKPPETLEDIAHQKAAVEKLEDSLKHYEQELVRMRRESEMSDRTQREIRMRAARTKAEYDELKKVYEVEFKEAQVKLAELKARAEAESKTVDPEALARYRQIKQHAMPPMAKINGDRCGGCNMTLPAAVLGRLNGGQIVECDNCGRMLFVPTVPVAE